MGVIVNASVLVSRAVQAAWTVTQSRLFHYASSMANRGLVLRQIAVKRPQRFAKRVSGWVLLSTLSVLAASQELEVSEASIEFFQEVQPRGFRDSELTRFQVMDAENADQLRELLEAELDAIDEVAATAEASCGRRLNVQRSAAGPMLDTLSLQVFQPFLEAHGFPILLQSITAQKCEPATLHQTPQAHRAPESFLFHLVLTADDEADAGPLFVLPKLPPTLADWIEFVLLPPSSSANKSTGATSFFELQYPEHALQKRDAVHLSKGVVLAHPGRRLHGWLPGYVSATHVSVTFAFGPTRAASEVQHAAGADATLWIEMQSPEQSSLLAVSNVIGRQRHLVPRWSHARHAMATWGRQALTMKAAVQEMVGALRGSLFTDPTDSAACPPSSRCSILRTLLVLCSAGEHHDAEEGRESIRYALEAGLLGLVMASSAQLTAAAEGSTCGCLSESCMLLALLQPLADMEGPRWREGMEQCGRALQRAAAVPPSSGVHAEGPALFTALSEHACGSRGLDAECEELGKAVHHFASRVTHEGTQIGDWTATEERCVRVPPGDKPATLECYYLAGELLSRACDPAQGTTGVCDPAGQCAAPLASCSANSTCSTCADLAAHHPPTAGAVTAAESTCLACPAGFHHVPNSLPRPWALKLVHPVSAAMRGFDCSGKCVQLETQEDARPTHAHGGAPCSSCRPPQELLAPGEAHPAVLAAAPVMDSVYPVNATFLEAFLRDGVVMARHVAPELQQYRPFFQEAYIAGMVQYYYHNLAQEACTCARLEAGAACANAPPEEFPFDPTYLEDVARRRDTATLRAMLKQCEVNGNATVAFLQQIDLRRLHRAIERWALGKRLARVASQLLGVPSLRLYQDAMFVKDGRKDDDAIHLRKHMNRQTGWHMELTQVPVDTEAYVTAWCPLRRATEDDSILVFAPGSHEASAWSRVWKNNSPARMPSPDDVRALVARIRQLSPDVKSLGTLPKNMRLELKEKEEVMKIWKSLLERPVTLTERQKTLMKSTNLNITNKFHQHWAARFRVMTFGHYEVGDCSFHSGRVMHAAPRNSAATRREAVTLTYIDARAVKMPMEYHKIPSEDKLSFQKWVDDIDDWHVIEHPELPLVYDQLHDSLYTPRNGQNEQLQVNLEL
ncbi:hypothetical protein CYMTET_34222 [Cymbomonas tetramitiformis]|uniref:Uncharacterized protein n=1 Tax=Cymbomonas tetramitiformis TaxID=36881 RepID=A0AAE0FBI0_9CHLO|nr:hypothetical protein CYMTET_34222 [Cymbomonas tetramitiformis]